MWMSWGKVEMVVLNSHSRKRLLVNVNADETWEFAFYKNKPNMASPLHTINISVCQKYYGKSDSCSFLADACWRLLPSEWRSYCGNVSCLKGIQNKEAFQPSAYPPLILYSLTSLSFRSVSPCSVWLPYHANVSFVCTFSSFSPSSQRSPLCVFLWEGSLLVSTRAGAG